MRHGIECAQLQKALGLDENNILARRTDAVHLRGLLEEIVPDANELDLGEVLRIRQDDKFEQWRTDLRIAIRRMIAINSIDDLANEGIEEMWVLMHENAIKIREAIAANGSMARLRKEVASFAIGGIGLASVTPIIGQDHALSELAMLGGSLGVGTLLIGITAVARSLRASQAGNQALAYHYSFVGKCAKR